MVNQSKPQFVFIEQPFGCDPSIAHCPICGQASMDEDFDVTACDHLVFIYGGLESDYSYQSEAYQEKIKPFAEEDLEEKEFEDIVAEIGYGHNLLVLAITSGGMACGPVWSTDYYGFDYDTLKSSESAE